MNNDIKEILDRLEKIGFYASVPKELAYMTTNITPQECKTILDYIINIQEEINKLTSESTEWEERTYCWQDRAENLEIIIDKAIELLQKYGNGTFDEDLLNILQGSDKE